MVEGKSKKTCNSQIAAAETVSHTKPLTEIINLCSGRQNQDCVSGASIHVCIGRIFDLELSICRNSSSQLKAMQAEGCVPRTLLSVVCW